MDGDVRADIAGLDVADVGTPLEAEVEGAIFGVLRDGVIRGVLVEEPQLGVAGT